MALTHRSLYLVWAFCVSVSMLGGCAARPASLSIPTLAPDGTAEPIPATLRQPYGPGPFPAVVFLHDCSGLSRSSSGAPQRWAKELLHYGYVTLIPDSFTTRGHPSGVCTDASPSRIAVDPTRRTRDAYAALAYLRTLPAVDGQRVGLMGGSHSGSTTLATLVTPDPALEVGAAARHAGFAAAVALYPGCARLDSGRASPAGVYAPTAPVPILIGDKDDWTPAEPCRQLTAAARAAGYPVTIKIYPGAHHAFDSYNPVRYLETRVNANAPTGRGATTGGNYFVWTDSIREVVAFFGQHLK
jgi:dienelactone hydrolase